VLFGQVGDGAQEPIGFGAGERGALDDDGRERAGSVELRGDEQVILRVADAGGRPNASSRCARSGVP
jgi:hypothetical protein